MKLFFPGIFTVFVMVAGFSFPACALVVSDPGAYTRMAQEITKLSQLAEQTQKTLDQVTKVSDSVNGAHVFSQDMLGKVAHYRQVIDRVTHALPLASIPDGERLRLDVPDQLRTALDQVFVPSSRDPYSGRYNPLRKNYRDKAMKSALERAELTLSRADETFSSIDRLAKDANQTQTLKASLDLNNRILLEVLMAQQQMVFLLSDMNRMQASLRYEGVDSESVPVKDKEPWEKHLAAFSLAPAQDPFFKPATLCARIWKMQGKC